MSEQKKESFLERLDKAGAGALAIEGGVDSAEIWRTAYTKSFYEDECVDGKAVHIRIKPQAIINTQVLTIKNDKK